MTTTETRAIAVGDSAAEHAFGPLTLTDIVRYAGASGDMNPLHHDEEFAKAAGFAGIFSIGMFQAGLLGTFAANWLGAENVRRFTTRFKEQVWPGDTLTCTGEVIAVRPGVRGERSDGESALGSTVEVKLACTRQTGGVAIDGSAEFWLPA